MTTARGKPGSQQDSQWAHHEANRIGKMGLNFFAQKLSRPPCKPNCRTTFLSSRGKAPSNVHSSVYYSSGKTNSSRPMHPAAIPTMRHSLEPSPFPHFSLSPPLPQLPLFLFLPSFLPPSLLSPTLAEGRSPHPPSLDRVSSGGRRAYVCGREDGSFTSVAREPGREGWRESVSVIRDAN